ncbi:MAG: OmpA family protein [Treponema sp.]|jgi:flagellar motor protein MotB|nr:OmpA family protein [Treponema sp.]
MIENKFSIRDNFYIRAFFLPAAVFFFAVTGLFADPPKSPVGADAVPDLYAPNLAGSGGFTTTTGGAPASALNPAQGGTATRMIFDVGYLAVVHFPYGNNERDNDGYMQSLEAGALFPTRHGVFGGSVRYIGGFGKDQFESFPVDPAFGGNFFAAKEVYPGMSLGFGLNYGFGADWTLSGDIGIHYNVGKLGPFDNFTWAAVLRGLGKSYYPTWFTPAGGISLDVVNVEGKEGKRSPFVLNASADISFPSVFYWPYLSMIIKTGLKMTFGEVINLSFSWPGASGLNVRELSDKNIHFQPIPSIGLGVNIILPSGGERIAGGRLPSDGDLKIDSAFKPLYDGVTAIGAGLSWYVGVADKKPPVISVDYPETAYFSPNNDGKADYLEFPIEITDDKFVASWTVEIIDEDGNIARKIENKEPRYNSFNFKEMFSKIKAEKKQIDIPPTILWDGICDSGVLAADGKYYFTITATDNSNNTSVSSVFETVVKNKTPVVRIEDMTNAQKIFNPKIAQGQRDSGTVTFVPVGSEEEAWESGIWNAEGVKIRTFETERGTPKRQVWDGKDDSGLVASDGVYSYRISTVDRAQNSASAEMNNIILDAREAGAFLTSSVSAIAPKPNQSASLVDFSIRLLLRDGIDSWKLEITNQNGETLRTFTGGAQIPSSLPWNGLDDKNEIQEGLYTPALTVSYTKGDVVKATATPVRVDVTGPALSFNAAPEYFSPDNDGEEDDLVISLSAVDASPITAWSLEIREPEPPYLLFRRIEGRGIPTSRFVWNGRSDKGELVQSATDYPYTFRAEDSLGNASSVEGKIGIDVLVIRDGDRLKIQIPSIEFRPNFADFEGLPSQTVDNNNRIIRRIAQILNKFRDYKVQVEGHANPTQPVGPARDREEPELKRISEARARAIVDQLVRNGVARSRLFIYGAGGSNPVVAYEDRDNWWKNRRVDFILIK